MKILVVEPGKNPAVMEIADSLEAMRHMVGGSIEAIYPFEEPVALVCNEEGKLLGLPLNRGLYHPQTHELYEIIAGTFFLCGAPPEEDHFVSLTQMQLEQYAKRFQHPEIFARINGRITAIPIQKEIL